jgi:L-cysteine desulfidase
VRFIISTVCFYSIFINDVFSRFVTECVVILATVNSSAGLQVLVLGYFFDFDTGAVRVVARFSGLVCAKRVEVAAYFY